MLSLGRKSLTLDEIPSEDCIRIIISKKTLGLQVLNFLLRIFRLIAPSMLVNYLGYMDPLNIATRFQTVQKNKS